jgi:hypothetical protein
VLQLWTGNPAKHDDTLDYLSSHAMYVAGTEENLAASKNGTAVGATVGILWLDIDGTQVRFVVCVWLCGCGCVMVVVTGHGRMDT